MENPTSLPGLERAKDAARRVSPALMRDLSFQGLYLGDPVFIRAFKEEKELELWVRQRDSEHYVHFRTWKIAAMSGELGPKLREGDGQVPEGFYFVPPQAMKPDSNYHLAFNIGYPNEFDLAHGRNGSFIMIHGNLVSIGCLAMTDEKIEEIYTLCDSALKHGQKFFKVHIYPFRMTPERIAKEPEGERLAFWKELQQGYDFFQTSHIPPEINVINGHYIFK